MVLTRSAIKAGKGSLELGLHQTRKRRGARPQSVSSTKQTSTPSPRPASAPDQNEPQDETGDTKAQLINLQGIIARTSSPRPASAAVQDEPRKDVGDTEAQPGSPEKITAGTPSPRPATACENDEQQDEASAPEKDQPHDEKDDIEAQPANPQETIANPADSETNDAPLTGNDEQALKVAIPPPPLTFTDGLPLPKFIVFDLDYTLWPFDIDWPATTPYLSVPEGQPVVLRNDEELGFCDDVPSILYHIHDRGIAIGAASRGTREGLARRMLSLLMLPEDPAKTALSVFRHLEIYPNSKIVHFESLQKKSGLLYDEMLFFDDQMYNYDVESLGVVMYLVNSGRWGGVRLADIDAGVELWRRKNNRTQKEES